ncbi:MAG TPA: phage portal protein [Acidimicrobiia bacterium]
MLGNLFERRSSAFQNLWAAGALTDRPSLTGVRVTEETSLRLSAVYASVRLIADTIATLPLDQYIRRDGQRVPFRPRDPWVSRPSLTLPRTTFWQQVMMSLLLDGNAFVHLGRDGAGRIVDLQVLNPTHVNILEGRTGYQVVGYGTLSPGEILHVTEMLLPGKDRGTSRIEQAKESLGLGLALQEYASTFFGNGAFPGVVLEIPGEPTLEQRQEIQATWENQHRGTRKAHKPAILMNGAKATPLTINPSESQLLEQRRYAVEEVARLFRVPPFMLGVTTPGSVSYASVEQQMLFYSEHTVRPFAEMLEAAFGALLINEDSFIKFNLNALVRADLNTRTAAYSQALLAGYMSVNEVRAYEDMRGVQDGDQYRVPLQNIPLTDAGLISAQQKATAAQQLVTAGYTPESVAAYLDIPVEHTGLPSVQLQQSAEPASEE